MTTKDFGARPWRRSFGAVRMTGLKTCRTAGLAAALLALLPAAPAHSRDGRALPLNAPAAYAQECAACHLAYPPGLLPARSWQRLMGGLDKHYGSDASLDAATQAQLSAWLQAHAGSYRRVKEEPPQDRITRSAWFERKHREVNPAWWAHSSVKSAANCAACHTGAARGDFDDDNVQRPPGLDAGRGRSRSD